MAIAPAIEQVGEQRFREALTSAYAESAKPGLGVRISSEFGWVTATKPTAADRR